MRYQVALQLATCPSSSRSRSSTPGARSSCRTPWSERWRWTARTGTALTRRRRPRCGRRRAARALARHRHGRPGFDQRRHGRSRSGSSAPSCRCPTWSTRARRSPCSTPSARGASRGPPLVSLASSSLVALLAGPAPAGIVGVAVAKASATPCSWALTTWLPAGHSPLRLARRALGGVVAAAALVVARRAVLPRSRAGARGCGSCSPLAVAAVGLLLAPRILRTLRG